VSLPHFPDLPDHFTYEKSIAQILTSIAMEEIGLSHVINAEGEKIQYILGTLEGSRPPTPPTIDQVIEINQTVRDTLQQVAFNQMFLSAKMADALKAYTHHKKEDHDAGTGTGTDKDTCTEADPPKDPDKKITLTQPNKYVVLEKGQTAVADTSTLFSFNINKESILSGKLEDGKLIVHGESAGVAYVAIGNQRGAVTTISYQVADSAKINEYTLKTGGKVFFTEPGQTKPSPLTAVPAAARNDIAWVSLNPAIAEVLPNGDIKAVKKGAAIIVGTFTDKWGVEQEIRILAGVCVRI
jgi:hypothetical protein